MSTCRYFQSQKGCRYGVYCRFRHDQAIACNKFDHPNDSKPQANDDNNSKKKYTIFSQDGGHKQLLATFDLAIMWTNRIGGDHLGVPERQWEIYGDNDSSGFTVKYRVAPELFMQELKDVTLEVANLTISRLPYQWSPVENQSPVENFSQRLSEYREMVDHLWKIRGIVFDVALLIAHYHGFECVKDSKTVYKPYLIHGN
jgi:hypothetical protein